MTEPSVLVFAYHDMGHACLDVLIKHGARIVAVITHEDDPKEHIWFKSVAELAKRHAIPVHSPASVNTPEWLERGRAWKPDLIFSFYYRAMIKEQFLTIPRLGAFNMHGSLLPKYRGRVPINWAVLRGERETGVTLHHMVKQADAGDIVDQEPVPIGHDDTAQDVFKKAVSAAVLVLERQLDALLKGAAPRRRQDESLATYFGGRKPEDGRIDWSHSAERIYNLVRAVTHPYPGAFTDAGGKQLYIWGARPVADAGGRPGEVVSCDPLIIAAGEGGLELVDYAWADGAARDLNRGELLGQPPASSTCTTVQGQGANHGA